MVERDDELPAAEHRVAGRLFCRQREAASGAQEGMDQPGSDGERSLPGGAGAQMKRGWLIAGACALLAGRALAGEPAAANQRFAFVALGCMPYGQENFAAYERLLVEINRQAPAFIVHCGDTKAGGEP